MTFLPSLLPAMVNHRDPQNYPQWQENMYSLQLLNKSKVCWQVGYLELVNLTNRKPHV